ncbi:MAG TPA: fumarylacetoacetate hydrolase family protein [Hypericibacter adhaerens]|jgi:2-keto-4-pentenoate hydratase|nr:fumarylacetoacetate hydrolase family protein [Hypericibacter adhaerens]HWA46218.1 fumarylacetoacetate hydrolase family protein [Hypericibacter adhaerens]
MAKDADRVAQELMRQHRQREKFRTLSPQWPVEDLEDAYAVQARFVARMRDESGAAIAGYKIGLTTKRMQHMCGIDHPIPGVVLADRVHRSGVRLDLADHVHLGFEFEICTRLGRDLPPGGAPYDREAVADAVDAVCAALEVVDDRGADYAGLDVRSLVADNSWNAGVVLGEFKTSWPELAPVEGVVHRNGEEIGRGRGADALGHPFEPLTWLANHLARSGGGLKAGDFVMTGSLITTRFPAGPERYDFDVSSLGHVDVTVG